MLKAIKKKFSSRCTVTNWTYKTGVTWDILSVKTTSNFKSPLFFIVAVQTDINANFRRGSTLFDSIIKAMYAKYH